MSTRPAAVAGLFYPGEPRELQAEVDHLLQEAAVACGERPQALVVPHAGHRYSGATAATAYARLRPHRDSYRRVVLLGPAHRVYVEGIAIPESDLFDTPIGSVPVSCSLLEVALAHASVFRSEDAHRQEHSLEVHLPFLQRVLGDIEVLPLLVGRCPPSEVAGVIDALSGESDTLFVVSTDLSHFHDYSTASALDRQTCQRILAGATDLRGEEACGAAPLNGFLASRHGSSLRRELIANCNSGDTAGDRKRVVGYASFVLH